ncbi:MAG: metal ABC transporter substrate-binding protein, partial [Lentisphaerae bacterium]|nr:metal ABC transporter substrate-binding protein [Lentisphaerota bacterium]
MIRAYTFLIGFVFLFSVSASAGTEKTRIVTSFYPMYVAVLNVAGNIPGVTVSNMTKQTSGCLHDYQLSPDDMKTLSNADIFVVNGAGMESFLEKVIKERPDLKIVNASKGIELIKDKDIENPHVWVSISLHKKQIDNIAAGLSKYDPGNARTYRKNADAYLLKLEELRIKIADFTKTIGNRDIITFHEAFPYFAKEFGLNIVAVVEREPGSDPDARELANTIDIIRREKVRILFAEPQYSARSAEIIAKETKAKL